MQRLALCRQCSAQAKPGRRPSGKLKRSRLFWFSLMKQVLSQGASAGRAPVDGHSSKAVQLQGGLQGDQILVAQTLAMLCVCARHSLECSHSALTQHQRSCICCLPAELLSVRTQKFMWQLS